MQEKTYTLSIYRYNPDRDKSPYMQSFSVDANAVRGIMLLDLLKVVKEQDASLAFRFSCGAGVCGSDGMNINGRNGLACMTALKTLPSEIILRPLPGMPVVSDLVVDMNLFYQQYHSVKPYLQAKPPKDGKEHKQSIAQRRELDGLYECILCACCYLRPCSMTNSKVVHISSRSRILKKKCIMPYRYRFTS